MFFYMFIIRFPAARFNSAKAPFFHWVETINLKVKGRTIGLCAPIIFRKPVVLLSSGLQSGIQCILKIGNARRTGKCQLVVDEDGRGTGHAHALAIEVVLIDT